MLIVGKKKSIKKNDFTAFNGPYGTTWYKNLNAVAT
jgi:hypothetical protein